MTLFRGTLVETVKDINEYGYTIKEGTVFEVVGADYEFDEEIYKLKGECNVNESSKDFVIWAFLGEFKPL